MSKKMRQPFSPGGKFVASKDFRFNDHRFARGDEFPWRRLACSVRKLRQMYEGRFLNNDYVDVAEIDETGELPEIETSVPVEEETTEGPLEVFDPDIHLIINPERGEWYITDAEDNRLLRLNAKEAKRLRKIDNADTIKEDGIFEEE